MKRWLSISTLLLAVTTLWGHGSVGDVVSPSGDSLALPPIVRLTSDGVLQRELYDDKTRARELFEEALKLDSMDVAANYQMALLLYEVDMKEAVGYAKRAFEGDTTNKWSMELYAQTTLMTGEYEPAKPLYDKLIEREPNNLDFYRILAIIYQYTSRPYSAIMVLDSAEVKAGYNPYLGRIKHNLLLSTKQEERAVEEAKERVANMPYDIESRLSLAQAYIAMGSDSLAEAEYNVAMQVDATSVDLLMGLCQFYEKQGRTGEYISTLKILFQSQDYTMSESLSLLGRMMGDKSFYRANYVGITELISTLALRYPQAKEVVDLRANHLIAFGMVDEALEIYKSHTRDVPPVIDYFQSVIEIESYKKRADSVALYLDRAISLFPEDITLYITKAELKGMAKEFDQAREIYDEALKRSGSDSLSSKIWGYIGDLEFQISLNATKLSVAKKAIKRCYSAYERALKLDADNIMVLNNYAYFISEEPAGDYERALEMSSRVVEISKNVPIYLDTHAWVLYRLGRYDEAVKYMRTAISLDQTKSPELPLHYGDILFAQGNEFMAEVYWRRAEAQGYSKEVIERRIKQLKKSEQ